MRRLLWLRRHLGGTSYFPIHDFIRRKVFFSSILHVAERREVNQNRIGFAFKRAVSSKALVEVCSSEACLCIILPGRHGVPPRFSILMN